MDAPLPLVMMPPEPGSAPAPSPRMRATAAMFGLAPHSALPLGWTDPLHLELRPGELVLITGPSGAGKSTLLRAIDAALGRARSHRGRPAVVRLEDLPLAGDAALVDCFAAPLEETLRRLAQAGLGEARLFLRAPRTLSEGEQFRFRLAQFFASSVDLLLADEFAATLDRTTARVVAWRLAAFIRGSVRTPRPRAAVLATSHEDLLEDLRPDLHIRLSMGGGIEISAAEAGRLA